MGMTTNNLCDSCINLGCEFQSGIVRTECDFYIRDMQKELEDKDIELYIDRETLLQEYIPRAEFEQRLKADLKAILVELQLEIEELDTPNNGSAYIDCAEIIQQKINALKENNHDD